jgi:hypothetical protein
MTDLRQEHLVHPTEAARGRTLGALLTGAGLSLDPFRTLATVTVRLIQPTVHTLSRHGILPEAEASTREEVRPEAVAFRRNVVVETTEEGSRDAAGGGHGAAGSPAVPLPATPPS